LGIINFIYILFLIIPIYAMVCMVVYRIIYTCMYNFFEETLLFNMVLKVYSGMYILGCLIFKRFNILFAR